MLGRSGAAQGGGRGSAVRSRSVGSRSAMRYIQAQPMRPSAVLQSISLRLLQRPWLDRASRRRDVLEIAALLSEGRPIELGWDEIEDREFLHLYDLLMDPLDELRQRSRVYESIRFALSLLSDVLGASLPAWREALMFPVQIERSNATHADWVRASQRYSSPWPDVESARLLGSGLRAPAWIARAAPTTLRECTLSKPSGTFKTGCGCFAPLRWVRCLAAGRSRMRCFSKSRRMFDGAGRSCRGRPRMLAVGSPRRSTGCCASRAVRASGEGEGAERFKIPRSDPGLEEEDEGRERVEGLVVEYAKEIARRALEGGLTDDRVLGELRRALAVDPSST